MSNQTQGNVDTIKINDLELVLPLWSGAQWPTDEPNEPLLQPVRFTLEIERDLKAPAESGEIEHSVDYLFLVDGLKKRLSAQSYDSLDPIADDVCQFVVDHYVGVFERFRVILVQPRASLLCDGLGAVYDAVLVHGQWKMNQVQHAVHGLVVPTIIGIHRREREARQDTKVTFEMSTKDLGCLKNAPKKLLNAPRGRAIVKQMYEAIYHSQYMTLEALASYVANFVLTMVVAEDTAPVQVKVSASKSHVLPQPASAEVVIRRTAADYAVHDDVASVSTSLEGGKVRDVVDNALRLGRKHTVVLALGSNMGDRFRNIEHALRLLEQPEEVLEGINHADSPSGFLDVVDTSFLYETQPMYVTEQPIFLNGACVVETNLSPLTLLRLVKEVESIVGRVPSIRNGPRAVDVDIVFYGDLCYDTRPISMRDNLDNLEGQLVIPHPRLAEREFVIRPMNDVIPDYTHPSLKKTVRTMLQEYKRPLNEQPMHKVVPFPKLPLSPQDTITDFPSISPVPHTAAFWSFSTEPPMKFKTQLMATLNTTPDSFSDGSKHNTLEAGMEYVCESVAAGSSIVDIGGYSTRPGALFVSAGEEAERVVPFVKAIRSDVSHSTSTAVKAVKDVLISIDTFRPEVARPAIEAGANCINDVYAFSGEKSYGELAEGEKERSEKIMEEMKAIAREYSTPVVLMHSRDDAGQNKDYTKYRAVGPQESVVEAIRVELGEKVDRIVKGKGGVRRWLVIADPGVGFSKSLEGNLETLRNMSKVTADSTVGEAGQRRQNPLRGYPQLVGSSRKSFLGAILSKGPDGRETAPVERTWATAAAVACAVQQGALIVRVHDVKEMHDVVKVSDALWRS